MTKCLASSMTELFWIFIGWLCSAYGNASDKRDTSVKKLSLSMMDRLECSDAAGSECPSNVQTYYFLISMEIRLSSLSFCKFFVRLSQDKLLSFYRHCTICLYNLFAG